MIEDMTRHQMILVLSTVKNYMGPEMRSIVMNTVPDAYNAMCKTPERPGDVVGVVRTSDGKRIGT